MPTTICHREPRVWRPDADPCDFKPLSSFSELQFPLICDKGPYCVKLAIVTVLRVKQVGAWGLPSLHPSQKPSRCLQGPQGSMELRVLKSPSPLFTLPPCHLASPQRHSQVEAPLRPVAVHSLRHCPLTPAELASPFPLPRLCLSHGTPGSQVLCDSSRFGPQMSLRAWSCQIQGTREACPAVTARPQTVQARQAGPGLPVPGLGSMSARKSRPSPQQVEQAAQSLSHVPSQPCLLI